MKKQVFIYLSFLIGGIAYSQPELEPFIVLEDAVYAESFKTCMLTPVDNPTAFPLIDLNSNQQLLLQFDDLGEDYVDYMYAIYHCNYDWTLSDLHPSEYIDGFSENYINDYNYSFNTKVPYVHYDLVIPNPEFRLTKSGNYIILVYDPDNSEEVLLSKRFLVVENYLGVEARVKLATLARDRYTKHEVDVAVLFGDYKFGNPIQDVHLAIHQGHRWDNVIDNLIPSFIDNRKLVYDFEEESSIEAGNEFRFFDTKSLRYYSERIQKIIKDSVDVVLLYADEPWANTAYSFNYDIDGYYLPRIQERPDASTQADYCEVSFCLAQKPILEKGDLYVYGALTDWTLKEEAKMKFDQNLACYETSLLLKQGYYNYTYLFVPEETEIPSQEIIDGNFYQTAHDYYVFVYVYDYNYGYDRLMGWSLVTTKGMF